MEKLICSAKNDTLASKDFVRLKDFVNAKRFNRNQITMDNSNMLNRELKPNLIWLASAKPWFFALQIGHRIYLTNTIDNNTKDTSFYIGVM